MSEELGTPDSNISSALKLRGLAVSPGVAVGNAYCLDDVLGQLEPQRLDVRELDLELKRLDDACEKAAQHVHSLSVKVSAQLDAATGGIFSAHELVLDDPSFLAKLKKAIIDQQCTAEAALRMVLDEYEKIFASISDEYLRERFADIRDVTTHVFRFLQADQLTDNQPVGKGVVLVAKELLPSQTVALGDLSIVGIVSELGGETSHTAILARGFGIPAVSGLSDVLSCVHPGDLLVVDGCDGNVILRPGREVEAAYRKLQREYVHVKNELIENHDRPCMSLDGVSTSLLANINNSKDAETAAEMGADGVGLYRTEYLYISHPDIPGEETQVQEYRRVVDLSPNHRVTFRTLDIGGDKTIPYLGHLGHQEANPFMGWRSIRLSLEHPDVFQTQLRAVLQSSTNGNVSLMFPMITVLDELLQVQEMIRVARSQLEQAGTAVGTIRIGVMIEVPVAALTIDCFLPHVDFVSIGSNDLIQYLTAADRDNPKVAHLYQPLNPAVLRLVNQVIQACSRENIPVTVCGEMAGSALSVLVLFGLGLRSFSMSPVFIPMVKDLIGHLSVPKAEKIAATAIQLNSAGEVQSYLADQLSEICPRSMFIHGE